MRKLFFTKNLSYNITFFKAHKGFTLIEIIIVISIILILGSISVPSILSYQNTQIEERFVNSYINQFKSSQVDAMTRDIDVRVVYNSSTLVVSFCLGPGFTVCDNVSIPASVRSSSNFAYTPATYFINRYGNVTTSAEPPPPNIANRINVNIKTLNNTVNITEVGGVNLQ